MYAIILNGGKQYKAAVGDVLRLEKVNKPVGEKIELDVLMTVNGTEVKTGSEVKAKAVGEVLGTKKDKKVIVFTYKPKKNIRKKKGHRQSYTDVKITKI